MIKYTKENPRITVKVYDSDSEELLITITDRNWMNVGEIYSDSVMTNIIKQEVKNKQLPSKITVIAVGEYLLNID